MSLLMDALRKAEEEKRKAAEQSGEAVEDAADQGSGTGDFEQSSDSIEFSESAPVQLDDSTEVPAGETATGTDTFETENTSTNTITSPAITAPEMSLEPVSGDDTGAGSPADAAIEMSSPDAFGDQTDVFDDSLEMRGPSDASLELLAADFTNQNKAAQEEAGYDTTQGSSTEPGNRMGDTTPRPSTPEELLSLTLTQDNDATVPSDRAIQNSLNDYFENSQSMDTGSLEMPRQTGPMAEAAAMDRTLGTPVNAETVFAAGSTRRSSRGMGLLIVSLVGIALLLAGGGLYYGLQTPVTKSMPPPSVVVGVEKSDKPEFELPEIIPRQTAPEELLAGELAEAELIARAQAGQSAEAASGVAGAENPLPMEPQISQSAAESEALPTPGEPQASDAMEDPAAAVLAAAEQTTTTADSKPAQPASAMDAVPVLSSGAIKISRGKKVSETDQTAASAYSAYTEGNLSSARSLYEDVIKRDPRSRNALLGLAGVALREGDKNKAYEYYRRVLSLFPADATANAAVLELQGYSSQALSDLKNRISANPQDPYLHFVLGNLHARNGNWGDAEQAYFEAVRLDPKNAEFAFNLAVSLDQLRQGDAALRFYQQALDGAGNRKVAFDTAAAASRIQALGNGGTP